MSSTGCHSLIRDGAILCTSPQELMNDMGWNRQATQLELFATEKTDAQPAPVRTPICDSDATALIQAIQQGHDTLDALCSALGMGAHSITPLLIRMQIERRILPHPGGRFSAV